MSGAREMFDCSAPQLWKQLANLMLLSSSERRRHRRDLSCDLIRVDYGTDAGQQSTFGVVEDVSSSGCSMVVDLFIPLTTHVRIQTADAKFEAICRHRSVREDGTYIVGLEFTNSHDRARARDSRRSPEV